MAPYHHHPHRPIRSQRQYDMMYDEEPPKPCVNSRGRASTEIDVVPPEFFAIGNGFHRPKSNNNNNTDVPKQRHFNIHRHKHHEMDIQTGNRIDQSRSIDDGPSPKALWFHMMNRMPPNKFILDGVVDDDDDDENHGNPIANEKIAIATNHIQTSMVDQSIFGDLPPNKVEFTSSGRRALMNRAMSEITLNVSQHPDLKQDDIELSPRVRHNNKSALRSLRSPKKVFLTSVLSKLYPDFDIRDWSDGNKNSRRKSAGDFESVGSRSDYDGFENDSYESGQMLLDLSSRSQKLLDLSSRSQKLLDLSSRSQKLLDLSLRSQKFLDLSSRSQSGSTTQLARVVEEDCARVTTTSISRKNNLLSFLFPRSRCEFPPICPDNSKCHAQSSIPKKTQGKKFCIPSLKKVVSVRRMFTKSINARDGTVVAAA